MLCMCGAQGFVSFAPMKAGAGTTVAGSGNVVELRVA